MGKADVNVNIWLSEKKRFANLFNGVIYGGRQVILPEDLEEVNPVSSVSVKNRTGKTKNMKKYRDIIMKWRNQATFVLLANESQDMVHYAMPHKVMLYDGMDYETQIRNNWKNFNDRRKQNKKNRTAVGASYRRRISVAISKKGSIDTDYFISLLLWLRTVGWAC